MRGKLHIKKNRYANSNLTQNFKTFETNSVFRPFTLRNQGYGNKAFLKKFKPVQITLTYAMNYGNCNTLKAKFLQFSYSKNSAFMFIQNIMSPNIIVA